MTDAQLKPIKDILTKWTYPKVNGMSSHEIAVMIMDALKERDVELEGLAYIEALETDMEKRPEKYTVGDVLMLNKLRELPTKKL